MKKFLALILAAMMIVCCFASCGSTAKTDDTTAADADTTATEAKVYHVGICQLVQHVALDAATQGFKDALVEALGEDNVVFDYQDASGEATNCTTIVSKFVSDEVDLILANATAPLQAAAQATDSIPVVGVSITDYATALEIADFNGTTGFNVTGASDLAPLSEQAAMIKELYPDAAKVAVLYCSSEANSKYQCDVITAELEKLGVEAKAYTFVDTNDVTSVTTSACEWADVIYIPTDNTAASNTEAIDNVCAPAGVPVVAGEEGICKGCGVATLSISYYDLGTQAGKMAAKILTEGADPATMEIEYAPNVTKEYIAERAEELGLTVPEEYVAISLD